jgi:hypothetical protein
MSARGDVITAWEWSCCLQISPCSALAEPPACNNDRHVSTCLFLAADRRLCSNNPLQFGAVFTQDACLVLPADYCSGIAAACWVGINIRILEQQACCQDWTEDTSRLTCAGVLLRSQSIRDTRVVRRWQGGVRRTKRRAKGEQTPVAGQSVPDHPGVAP